MDVNSENVSDDSVVPSDVANDAKYVDQREDLAECPQESDPESGVLPSNYRASQVDVRENIWVNVPPC